MLAYQGDPPPYLWPLLCAGPVRLFRSPVLRWELAQAPISLSSAVRLAVTQLLFWHWLWEGEGCKQGPGWQTDRCCRLGKQGCQG